MVLLILLLTTLTAPLHAETWSNDALEEKAASYLKLLDLGQYEKAWHDMSALFHDFNNPLHWQKRQETIRNVYGASDTRRLHSIRYRQSYNLSPDGQYVVVQFNSSYQNKSETRETVVLDCSSNPQCSVREYIIQ